MTKQLAFLPGVDVKAHLITIISRSIENKKGKYEWDIDKSKGGFDGHGQQGAGHGYQIGILKKNKVNDLVSYAIKIIQTESTIEQQSYLK